MIADQIAALDARSRTLVFAIRAHAHKRPPWLRAARLDLIRVRCERAALIATAAPPVRRPS